MFVAALWATGCAPAGVLTSARTLKPGANDHVASLEPQILAYRNTPTSESGDDFLRIGNRGSMPSLAPGYSLRVGVVEGFELGGKLTPHSLEINTKMALLDHKRFALSIAPRVHNGSFVPLLSPYYFRAPLLFTVDVTPWLSLTPRAGLGVVLGTARLIGDVDSSSGASEEYPLRDLLVEGGVGALFHVSPRVSLVFEPYVLTTPFTRHLESAAVGLGLIVHAGRR